MNEITVEYKTHRVICGCCNQKLPEPKISEAREFTFSEENMMDYAPWREIAEDKEEFNLIAQEFVYETIQFFATSSDDKLIIDSSEVVKVRKFIENNITA